MAGKIKKTVVLVLGLLVLGGSMKAQAKNEPAESRIEIIFRDAYGTGDQDEPGNPKDQGEETPGQSSSKEEPGTISIGSAKSGTGKGALPQTGEAAGKESRAGLFLAGTMFMVIKEKSFIHK